MAKHRQTAIAAAAILIVVHFILLVFRYGTYSASLWGDWIAAPHQSLGGRRLLVCCPAVRIFR